MPAQKLMQFLDGNNVKYVMIAHTRGYTSQEVAAIVHIKGRDFAKTVIVKVDGALAMAILPASYRVDLAALRDAAGANTVVLAAEREFRDRFAECETGAMPPFGNLYGMPVFVEESLTRNREIAFNAGSHHELIRLSYADYDRLVHPHVNRFQHAKAA